MNTVPRTDWAALIDSTWGPSDLSKTERVQLFQNFWTTIDEEFACFQDLAVDWDALYAQYYPEVAGDTISKGRLNAIMNHMSIALQEAHTKAVDMDIYGTPLAPGVPILMSSAWSGVGHFGAALTPLPDKSALVYRAVPSHPLGLVPGDIILGYDGRPWSELYQELLEAELPIIGAWGSSDSTIEHSWLMSSGMNWHLFDTVDILKHGTGEISRLSTSSLDTASMYLEATEQLPVPGVPFPDLSSGEIVYSGLIGRHANRVCLRHCLGPVFGRGILRRNLRPDDKPCNRRSSLSIPGTTRAAACWSATPGSRFYSTAWWRRSTLPRAVAILTTTSRCAPAAIHRFITFPAIPRPITIGPSRS